MHVMFAYLEPGILTGYYILFFSALFLTFCLVCAGVAACRKYPLIARICLMAAAVFVGFAVVLIVLAVAYGKNFSL